MAEDYQIVDLTLTLPRNPRSPYTPRDVASIRWIVLHHSAGPADQTPESIARFHIETRGWSGIAYNYLIYEDGRIFAARPLDVVPACVKGHNEESLCICFVGDFSTRPPSPPAIAAGVWLTHLLRNAYTQIVGVRGHREMPDQATPCPGAAFDLVGILHERIQRSFLQRGISSKSIRKRGAHVFFHSRIVADEQR